MNKTYTYNDGLDLFFSVFNVDLHFKLLEDLRLHDKFIAFASDFVNRQEMEKGKKFKKSQIPSNTTTHQHVPSWSLLNKI